MSNTSGTPAFTFEQLRVTAASFRGTGDAGTAYLLEGVADELVRLHRVISEVTTRLERARQALQWIVTDAVYKPPECLADPTVTERWPEVARLALIDTEAPK